jgi:hypothetical protein
MIRILLAAAVALFLAAPAGAITTLLPPGKMCLSDANGKPLTGGTVAYYIPGTTTPKTTWKDANQISQNTNPVVLDSAGCAVVYGEGAYRQIVKDSLGNPIWDQNVADTSGTGQGVAAFLNPGGRLTLQSGIPIMSGVGAANQSTVYYTPYAGNNIEIYNGQVLSPYTFAEISLPLDSNATHAGYHQTGKNFDLYMVNDITIVPNVLRLCTGPSWQSDTVRGSAATITYTTYGFLANFNTINCRFAAGVNDFLSISPWRGTYVGTIRAVADGQTSMVMRPTPAVNGNPPQMFVFNEYNRILMQALNVDTGGQYTVASGVIQRARGPSSFNYIQYVSGDISDSILFMNSQLVFTGATIGDTAFFCVGFDQATSCTDGVQVYVSTNSAVAQTLLAQATLVLSSVLGFHTVNAVEGAGGHTMTVNPAAPPGIGRFMAQIRM